MAREVVVRGRSWRHGLGHDEMPRRDVAMGERNMPGEWRDGLSELLLVGFCLCRRLSFHAAESTEPLAFSFELRRVIYIYIKGVLRIWGEENVGINLAWGQ